MIEVCVALYAFTLMEKQHFSGVGKADSSLLFVISRILWRQDDY